MILKRLSIVGFMAALLAAGILPRTADAQRQDSAAVRALLEQRDRQIKELLGPKGTEYTDAQRQSLKDIINGVIDYRSMAAYALQETWDTLSTAQRDEFVDVFSAIVRDHSMNNLDIYRAEVTYRTIRVEGDSAFVHTSVLQDNTRLPVFYDLFYGSGEWEVTDLIIDDVSTAEGYRNQFQRIINRRGYEALMEALRKRAAQARNDEGAEGSR